MLNSFYVLSSRAAAVVAVMALEAECCFIRSILIDCTFSFCFLSSFQLKQCKHNTSTDRFKGVTVSKRESEEFRSNQKPIPKRKQGIIVSFCSKDLGRYVKLPTPICFCNFVGLIFLIFFLLF